MAKKIEDKYKELSEVEHILLRPGMWVGSTKTEERDMFLYNTETERMESVTVEYIPAMLKVVDEVISNACDEFRRKDNMGLTELTVNISQETGQIIIKDNGGIPVVKHKDAGVYLPEFIFGRLRTSSNYNDDEDRNVVGTNGVGSSLTNCFSKYFCVETQDNKHKFHRSWSNNMTINDDLEITKSTKHSTKITFNLDFSRFNCDGFSNDFIRIINKRCIDAAIANPGLKVTFISDIFEEQVWKFKSFTEYIELYADLLPNMEDSLKFDNKLANVYIFPDSSIDVAFVNGAECSKGTHIRAVRNEINNTVVEFLKKKDKIDVTTRSVDGKYAVFMTINVSNPTYDSQTKETLTNPVDKFSKDSTIQWEVPDKFLTQVTKSEIIESMRDWYKQKVAAEDQKTLRKLNSEAKKGLKRPDKYITCSSKKKEQKQLWIFEGDSARSGFRSGRNPEIQAGYTMRGVPPNVLEMTATQIMKNEVFNDLVTILGLQWGEDFDIKKLNYGKIVISSDADVDGDKIASLLLLFFSRWPELISKNIVCRSVSPIIIAKKNKDIQKFYNVKDFNKVQSKYKTYVIKYTKGLGSLDDKESKDMYQNPNFIYFKYDNLADNMFKKWFSKDAADTRKSMLSNNNVEE
jgi:DNA topoisomerase-2